MVPERRSVAEI